MKKKIMGILVCMLLVIPVLLVVATEKETTEKSLPASSNGIYEGQKTYDSCHLDSAYPFGVFGDIFYDSNTGRLNLDEAIELGNQITRLIIPWWMVEPEKGEFTFDLPDLVIDMHYNARISPVITLLSNSEWATREIGGPEITGSSPPINMTQYERYVRTVVNRYKDKVEYWQIENEIGDTSIESSTRFWNGTKEEYLELLQHAYITIKQVDPDAKVVLQGFADGMLILINEGNTTIQEFFEYLMNNGSSYFDVIDFHQYFEPDTVYLEVNILKETMSKYGYQKELICTEAGDLDLRLFGKHILNPDEPIPIIEKLLLIDEVALELMEIMEDGVTEQERIDFAVFLKTNSESRPILEKYQAENLVKRVSLTLSQGVKQIHWLGMIDSEASVAVDWYWAMMPLIDTDGRKKPHFYTYKLLIDELENFTSTNEISFNPDEKIIQFNFSDKNDVYAIWGKNSTTVNLSGYVSTDYVHVTHIVTGLDEGNNPIYPQDEFALSEKIPISETPIFVEETSVQINVNIARPKEGHLYAFDQEIMPTIFHSTIIIGEITIEADAYDEAGIDRVEFYIDDELKFTDYNMPYDWLWDEFAFGRHEIKAIVYDNKGNTAKDKIDTIIFNIGAEDCTYEKINITAETANKGVFDPSVEYESNNGWLAYSALISPPNQVDKHLPKYISTHLAKSCDSGKTWIFTGEINPSIDGKVRNPDEGVPPTNPYYYIQGVWWNEVPTLLYDPDDPGKEWKLFWHKYFAIPEPFYSLPGQKKDELIRLYPYSYIAYKAAATPAQLAAANEELLFAGWEVPNQTIKAKINLNSEEYLDFDYVTYSEPGSLYKDGDIYLTLSAFTGNTETAFDHKVVMLSSSDHAKTWKYVGDILDHNDASSMGYIMFPATSIAEENGRVFLLATPVDDNGNHRGTFIFEFDDISQGKLKRDMDGKLIAHKYLPRSLPGEWNSGQSSYHESNTYGGIIMPQADLDAFPAIGQIFNTKEKIVSTIDDEFSNEQKVEIIGYDGDAMEPYISRDEKYLFFNNKGKKDEGYLDLFYAEKVDDLTFEFKGEIQGVNTPEVDGNPTMDSKNNFYFITTRDAASGDTIYTGVFENGYVKDLEKVKGTINVDKEMWFNMGVEISRDGTIMYTSNARFEIGNDVALEGDIRFAIKEGNEFNIPENEAEILKNINTDYAIEYAGEVSDDGLELFYSQLILSELPQFKLYHAKRNNSNEPFETPKLIVEPFNKNKYAFVEAPTLSSDGKRLYYHKYNKGKFSIFMLSRAEKNAVCGNGICEEGESKLNCIRDCRPNVVICGDDICDIGETVENCLEDCEVVDISGNPFGLHATGGNAEMANELAAGTRVIIRWSLITPQTIRLVDNYIIESDNNIVISLYSNNNKEQGDYTYPLIEGRELEQWKTIVGRLVERYDGDNDWGCVVNTPDCYALGDNLYPTLDARNAIKEKPVKYWQVENEWLWEIRDPNNFDARPSKEELLAHFITIRNVIKEKDPAAKIILGAFTGTQVLAGLDGFFADPFFEFGFKDCEYTRFDYATQTQELDVISNAMFGENCEDHKNRVEFLVKEAAPYYDIIDFHSYENNPLNLCYETAWLEKTMQKQGVYGKEIWSTESSGPFWFFPLMGLPKPDDCTESPYDSGIHSSQLIKIFTVGLNSGIQKVFYHSLIPTLGLSDNFLRLSLIDEDNNKKPAYYTYKLMTEKLAGANQIEKLDDFIYKFSFDKRLPVFVAWNNNGAIINLTSYISTTNTKITHIVTERDSGNNPIYPPDEIVPTNSIYIDETPVFVEETSVQINVNITRPKEGHLYVSDQEIMPTIFHSTIIIGEITIEADAYDEDGIDRVEFYIDNVLKNTDDESPYEWLWDERTFGMHEIKVIAYDSKDNKSEDIINITIFNLS